LHQYSLFLFALFVLASGITLLQVAANPYVTILGRPETASSRLTLTQAFNSLGTAIAPFLGSIWLLSIPVKSASEVQALAGDELVAYQAMEAANVQYPYLIIAAVLWALSLIFLFLKLPQPFAVDTVDTVGSKDNKGSAWQHLSLRLGVLGIFLYVGAEVAIGSFMVSFLTQPNITGMSIENAGQLVSLYWGGAMLGRFIGAWLMQYFRAGVVLAIHGMLACILVLVASQTDGELAKWSLLAVGLCNSIMFPTLFSLALTGLGQHSGEGSGYLCSAIVGGALIPVLQGVLTDQWGLQLALLLPATCYAFIMYYGWRFRSLAEPT
jgi:FHS family L-fucose permease-like MFS transporter